MGLLGALASVAGKQGVGLWVTLGLDKQQLETGLAQAKTSLVNWRNETLASTGEIAKWGAAIGATAAPLLAVGYAVVQLTEKFGAMADELNDLSYATGLSTDKMQDLKYAAILSNDNFGTVANGIQILTKNVADFNDTSSQARAALLALGVDPTGKGMDEVFDEVAVSLAGVNSETDRAKIANDMFGKSWKDMIPFLKDYVKNRDEIKKRQGWSQDEINELENAKAAWDSLVDSVTIYTGKVLAAGQAHVAKFKQINLETGEIMEKVDAVIKETNPDMDAYSKVTDKATKSTAELAKSAQDAQRKFVDLQQSIRDGLIAQRDTELDQEELAEKKAKLLEEQRKNELIIAHDPNSSQAAGLIPRQKEIGRELERLQIQIDRNNQTLIKGTQSMSDAYQDMINGVVGATQEMSAGVVQETEKQVAGVSAAYQSQIDDMGIKYGELEGLALVHWATLDEIGRVALEQLMGYMQITVDYAGANPIRQAYIIETATGPNWNPPVYKAMPPPKLTQADFTNVGTGVQKIVERGTGTGSKTINIVINNPVAEKPSESLAKMKQTARGLA